MAAEKQSSLEALFWVVLLHLYTLCTFDYPDQLDLISNSYDCDCRPKVLWVSLDLEAESISVEVLLTHLALCSCCWQGVFPSYQSAKSQVCSHLQEVEAAAVRPAASGREVGHLGHKMKALNIDSFLSCSFLRKLCVTLRKVVCMRSVVGFQSRTAR